MPVYTCDPNLELLGQTARSLLENINQDAVEPYLEKYDLVDVHPDEWVPAQSVLNVMNELSAEHHASSDFVAIGMKAAGSTKTAKAARYKI